ncbi:selenoprotein H-like [Tropilaelaps mercedesae]|uniref:Selenoprotein H-like n=1 Tax=Tropilaelaps mercedesae TaxID=418985 RepID=A0A1V9XV75_9ACAR|nr:selenoprotein H-like [Tropilaelaps mercedesae]
MHGLCILTNQRAYTRLIECYHPICKPIYLIVTKHSALFGFHVFLLAMARPRRKNTEASNSDKTSLKSQLKVSAAGKKHNDRGKRSRAAAAAVACQPTEEAVENVSSTVLGKGSAEINPEATSKSSKGGIRIVIEHWRHAMALKEALIEAYPSHLSEESFDINVEKPRSKSFELTLVRAAGDEELVWTGLKLGPPRSLKFPSKDKIVELFADKIGNKADV